MGDENLRAPLAADGAAPQRDLTVAEARAFDAAIAVRIDAAVADADFTDVPPVECAKLTSELRRKVAALGHRGDVTPLA